jgi:cbb3-type cytochrome oxidase subunit 1
MFQSTRTPLVYISSRIIKTFEYSFELINNPFWIGLKMEELELQYNIRKENQKYKDNYYYISFFLCIQFLFLIELLSIYYYYY